MDHTFDYQLSDELQRLATRRFMLFYQDRKVALVAVLYLVLLWLLRAIGGSEMLVGLFLGAILLLALLVILSWVIRRRRGIALLAKLPTRAARCRIHGGGIHMESALGTLELSWPMIERLLRAPDVWLLFLSRYEAYPLPASEMEGEPGRYVARKVAEAGGKVVDRGGRRSEAP